MLKRVMIFIHYECIPCLTCLQDILFFSYSILISHMVWNKNIFIQLNKYVFWYNFVKTFTRPCILCI